VRDYAWGMGFGPEGDLDTAYEDLDMLRAEGRWVFPLAVISMQVYQYYNNNNSIFP
jgi:hypothetical protein